MNLFVRSATLRDGDQGRFPARLRQLICDAVAGIDAEELEGLLAKHEADPRNFDGKVEANLRRRDSSLVVKANCRISDSTKFDNDIVIEADDALVCLEIEKGNMSRFEFDILKMQAFASCWKRELPGKPIFGAFVVRADNVVARHISGNTGESSYRYLMRLCRLVAQIDPFVLDDILIVGYSASIPDEQVTQRETGKMKKTPSNVDKKNRGNVVAADAGLLPEELLWDVLKGYPRQLVDQLRKRLAAEYPKLREKINRKSKYLGYANGGSDAMYVYVQKKRLLIDLRLSSDMTDDVRRLGFKVKPRDSYQSKAGWLTGLIVPHDTDKLDDLARLAIEALSGQ